MQKIRCEVDYLPSSHLTQVYCGLEILRDRHIIDLVYNPPPEKYSNKPILNIKVNGTYNVFYDLLDGFNWIEGTRVENLQHFRDNYRCDYYFKRSYNEELLNYAPDNCQVFPLGLNYPVKEKFDISKGLKNQLKNLLRSNYVSYENFEYYPHFQSDFRVLFLTKLWNPDEVSSNTSKAGRERINKTRCALIRRCRKEYGDTFTGGLMEDSFSLRYAKDLVIPRSRTSKKQYLETIRKHPVCISSIGLHLSTPWKIAEYVAASRAIITDPLFFDAVGDFESGKNFIEFLNEEELISSINYLRGNSIALHDMMGRNWCYYNTYLRPDCLMLNSLLLIDLK